MQHSRRIPRAVAGWCAVATFAVACKGNVNTPTPPPPPAPGSAGSIVAVTVKTWCVRSSSAIVRAPACVFTVCASP
jgi:hypothetical protein